MWFREFKDYPIDSTLIHNKVESGKGITGCEMHDHMGWGNQIHIPPKRRKGMLSTLLSYVFGSEKVDHDNEHS